MPIKKVPVQNVRAEFTKAAEHIKNATKNNVVVSAKELADSLEGIGDKRERALIKMLFKYAGHLDDDHLTTKKDVDNAIKDNLDRLVDGRDLNKDGNLSNQESRILSKMGKIAYAIAKSRIEPAPDPGPPQFGEMLDRAIAAGVVQVEMEGNNIVGAKVDENYGDGGLVGEPELLGMILDLPQAKNIKNINIGYIEEWEETDTYEEAIKVIADHGPLDNLKNLFVGDFTWDQTEISWVDLGDVSALYKAAPNLEELKLRGAGIELGDLKHDDLKKISIETGGLPEGSMGSLGGAKLPNLEDLSVWFGDSEYGFEGEFQALMGLLNGDDHPKLKNLGIQNAEFTDEIMPSLLDSKVIPQLEVLDLSMGTLSDVGAQLLLDHADDLGHLQRINLDENFISEGMGQQLKAAFGERVTFADPKEDYDEERYVSVGE